MECYESEARKFPHPRSPEALRARPHAGVASSDARRRRHSSWCVRFVCIGLSMAARNQDSASGLSALTHPVYVIAEVSANHHQDLSEAVKIIRRGEGSRRRRRKAANLHAGHHDDCLRSSEFRVAGTSGMAATCTNFTARPTRRGSGSPAEEGWRMIWGSICSPRRSTQRRSIFWRR